MDSHQSPKDSTDGQYARLMLGEELSQRTAKSLSASEEASRAATRLVQASTPPASAPSSRSSSLLQCGKGLATVRRVHSAEEVHEPPQSVCFTKTDCSGANAIKRRSGAHYQWSPAKDRFDTTLHSGGDFDAFHRHNLVIPHKPVPLALLLRASRVSLRTRYFHVWWRAVLRPVACGRSRAPVANSPPPLSHFSQFSRRSSRSASLLRVFYFGALCDAEAAAREHLERAEAPARRRLIGAASRAADEMFRRALRGSPPRRTLCAPRSHAITNSAPADRGVVQT